MSISTRTLGKRIITGKRPHENLLAYLHAHLPRMNQPCSKQEWLRTAATVRKQVLASFFRGHPPGVLDQGPRVQWTTTIRPGKGYRIRKLRYEGYPGMWIPALLYEPDRLRGKVPVVLNPNGHHPGGKAMAYKQARCINLAKRGVLALNIEFIGMGELRADSDHWRIAHLDLCGVAGVGVFYLAMKRGLDVLLSHRNADSKRVIMTGLSGGGWQTAMLSALDLRVKGIVPVAGHTPVWQRVGCHVDIGDLEQVPCDLCSIADFDTLSAMFAPRPTLLIYNHNDDCCFQTKRARKSIYEPIKPIFDLLGASDKLHFHDNLEPGTHNYDRDNRSQLYTFLNRHFSVDGPSDDLTWKNEILTESELSVGLPDDNATLISLARAATKPIKRRGKQPRRQNRGAARKRLAELLCYSNIRVNSFQRIGSAQKEEKSTIKRYLLKADWVWELPMVEIAPAKSRGVSLVVSDFGRVAAHPHVVSELKLGRRVLVADILGTGELATNFSYEMVMATAGDRPLGVKVAQLCAVARWACVRYRCRSVHLKGIEEVSSVVALLTAALQPSRYASLTTYGLTDTLGRLIDVPHSYAGAPSLYCFGLFKEFDVPDLHRMASAVPWQDECRGLVR